MNARKRQRRRMERAARGKLPTAEQAPEAETPATATAEASATPEGHLMDRVRRELREALEQHSGHEALGPAMKLVTSGAKRPTPEAVANGLDELGALLTGLGQVGPGAVVRGAGEVLRALGEMAK